MDERRQGVPLSLSMLGLQRRFGASMVDLGMRSEPLLSCLSTVARLLGPVSVSVGLPRLLPASNTVIDIGKPVIARGDVDEPGRCDARAAPYIRVRPGLDALLTATYNALVRHFAHHFADAWRSLLAHSGKQIFSRNY